MGAPVDPRIIAGSEAVPLALEELSESERPVIIGVRHHSPTLASAMPTLLDAARPDVVLLEMAEELQPWIEWLESPELAAPIALGAARRDGRGLLFYPLADFSPELAAIRWAGQHGVMVQAFDLPLGVSEGERPGMGSRVELPDERLDLLAPLSERFEAPTGDELWDRMVEVLACGSSPESVRRAGLAVGWALRLQEVAAGGASVYDLRRETWMRLRLREALEANPRVTAIVGAFHAAALLEHHADEWPARKKSAAEVVTSMVPYSFALLDSRSGYPAGIRDPEYQQSMWEGACTPETADKALIVNALRVCRDMRAAGHPAGVPDTRETVRFGRDLARLRGLPAPGRRELVEALQTCLAQGEPFGRGRAVASAMQNVLVGNRRGKLPAGAPRSGLAPHVERLLAELRLPGPTTLEAVDVRFDPLRSDLDRRREITVQRMRVAGIPYSEPLNPMADDSVTITRRWRLAWGPATSALIEVAAMYGVTLEQAAFGRLQATLSQARSAGGIPPGLRLHVLESAAEAGLGPFAWAQAQDLAEQVQAQASLAEIVQTIDILDRLRRGHIPGFQVETWHQSIIETDLIPRLVGSAVRQIEGLAGSHQLEDAQALLSLVQRERAAGSELLGDERLRHALRVLADTGSPLMQGASGALRVLLSYDDAQTLGERLGSWVDAATDAAAQPGLAQRLRGTLLVASSLLEASPEITNTLIARITALDTAAFLRRLPALRDGFEVLSPAARRRFLNAIRDRLGGEVVDLRLDYASPLLAAFAEADVFGRAAVERLDQEILKWTLEN